MQGALKKSLARIFAASSVASKTFCASLVAAETSFSSSEALVTFAASLVVWEIDSFCGPTQNHLYELTPSLVSILLVPPWLFLLRLILIPVPNQG